MAAYSESSDESQDESGFTETTLEDRNNLEDARTCLDGLDEIHENLDDNCIPDCQQALEGTLEGDVIQTGGRAFTQS